MNVEQLIAELQTMPKHIEVRVFVRGVWVSGQYHHQEPADASTADRARYEGSFVLIEGD